MQGICPAGWHIPTDGEWYILENVLKDVNHSCNAIRSDSWDCATAGTKLKFGGAAGFEGNLAGFAEYSDNTGDSSGLFWDHGTSGYFWTSTASGTQAYFRRLNVDSVEVNRGSFDKRFSLSVRCLMN
jgi:uncharacterized protein (TIGR02145 family)